MPHLNRLFTHFNNNFNHHPMKAIICDTCGKIVPSGSTGEIMPFKVSYGIEPAVSIERDICAPCLDKALDFLNHEYPDPKPECAAIPNQARPELLKVKVAETTSPPKPQNTRHKKPKYVEKLSEITCINCGKKFIPTNNNAKCCGHKCSHENWKRNKNKSDTTDKAGQDRLLQKLKSENPIREIKEPDIYREM